MRSGLILTSFMAALALAWLVATPRQRADISAWLLAPQAAAPLESPSGIDRKQLPSPRPAIARPLRARRTAAREEEHRDEEPVGSPCGSPPTLAVTEVQASPVFQFKDRNGVASFSDRRPVTRNARDVSGRYRRREQYFRIRLLLDQAPGAVRLRDRIMADTEQIFMFLARHLEVDNLRQVFLDLRLYPDKESFARYRRQVAPSLTTSTGFYSPTRNEAVVRMRHADSLTMEVIRHETSHLIAAALFGRLPKWLNEGLAEYFERMDVGGQAKTIKPSRYYLKILREQQRNGTLPQLRQHLKLKTHQWLRLDQKLSYGMAWSLVYHLMADANGRHFLATLLDAQAAHRCRRFDTAAFIERNYPGGITGLDQNWRRWLTTTDPVAQYF